MVRFSIKYGIMLIFDVLTHLGFLELWEVHEEKVYLQILPHIVLMRYLTVNLLLQLEYAQSLALPQSYAYCLEDCLRRYHLYSIKFHLSLNVCI